VRRARIISDTSTEAAQARQAIAKATIIVGQFGDGHKSIRSQKLTAVINFTVSSHLGPRKSAYVNWRFADPF